MTTNGANGATPKPSGAHWAQSPQATVGVSTADIDKELQAQADAAKLRGGIGNPQQPGAGDAGTQPNTWRMPGDPTPDEPERPNDFHRYDQIPAVLWKSDWTKADVDNALRQHELGNFTASALLAEAMTRDDAVDAVLQTRVGGMLGLDKLVTPATLGNKRGNKQIQQVVESRFDEFFPRSALFQILRWGVLMGFAIAQIVWKLDEDEEEWIPSLEVWHPIFTYVRLDTNTFYVYTTEGIAEVVPGTGQWLLYTPGGERYAWFNGAIRSIALPWLARQYAWRDWLRWSELYSLGVRKAFVPANASSAVKSRFFNQVANVGAAPTVLCEENEPGKRFDLEVMWPDATNAAQGYEKLLNKCESKIAIRINGQNLTTEVKGGSLAAARVHENVKQDILQSDSKTLGECCARDVVTPYLGFHAFPAKTRSCVVGWVTDTPEDAKTQADKLAQIGAAFVDLKTSGAPFDQRATLDKFDIPTLPEGAPVPLLPAPPQPTPGGSPPPDASAPATPDGSSPPANASSTQTTALAAGAAKPAPHLRHAAEGQAYVDDLATAATGRARAAMAPTVRAVSDAINGAENYADLQHKLSHVLGAAKRPDKMAKLVEQTIVMAHLAGRRGARKERTDPTK